MTGIFREAMLPCDYHSTQPLPKKFRENQQCPRRLGAKDTGRCEKSSGPQRTLSVDLFFRVFGILSVFPSQFLEHRGPQDGSCLRSAGAELLCFLRHWVVISDTRLSVFQVDLKGCSNRIKDGLWPKPGVNPSSGQWNPERQASPELMPFPHPSPLSSQLLSLLLLPQFYKLALVSSNTLQCFWAHCYCP